MQKSFAICALGSANTDFNFNVVEFPKEGETIQATKSYILNGGKGSNQAVAAGRLLAGDRVLFAGQMGKDDKATGLEKEMTTSGVDLRYCRRLENADTGHAFIMINSHGENIIVIVGGANMQYDDLTQLPEEFKKAIDETKIVLLQREIPNEINLLAAKYAKENGKVIFLDLGGRDEPLPEKMIDYIDFISPNQTELARFFNVEESQITEELIKERLVKKHPNLKIILKQGSKGSRLITKDFSVGMGSAGSYNEKIAEDHKILNTVGAGDCLAGSFAVAYFEKIIEANVPESEKIFKECLLFANTAAYLSCTKDGAMNSMPTRKTVDEFFAKYLSHVQI